MPGSSKGTAPYEMGKQGGHQGWQRRTGPKIPEFGEQEADGVRAARVRHSQVIPRQVQGDKPDLSSSWEIGLDQDSAEQDL